MSFGRCLLFLLHDITGILHRAAEVADSRESVLEPEEPLVAMNQHKVVEAIKYVRDALLVFGLVLLGHQDVAYARYDQRCPGTTARVFKQGYQFKGKLFAAKRKELGYQNVGSEAAKATEQLLLAQDLGFFQPKRRITYVDVRNSKGTGAAKHKCLLFQRRILSAWVHRKHMCVRGRPSPECSYT